MIFRTLRRIATISVAMASFLSLSSAADAAVGRTAGTFDVSAGGAATYEIPIWMPPGPHGLQPHLAFSYNSQSADGSMGPGWMISGLSSISRCNKTVAQDGAAAPVTLAASDGYCLNGNRLRVTSGLATYGVTGSTYQTESADFSLATLSTSPVNGWLFFTVKGKDGLTYEYGNTADSRPTGSWLLNKVTDRAGNTYIVVWTSGQPWELNSGVPFSISYTPSSAGATDYAYYLLFRYASDMVYGPGGTDVGYVGGTLVKNAGRLVSVNVYTAASLTLRKYVMGYQAAPTTIRPRLASITECSDDAQTDCLAPTVISYQDGTAGVAAATTAANTGATSGEVDAVDINGDGRADLLYSTVVSPTSNHWYVKFADSSGGFGPAVDTGIIAMVVDTVTFTGTNMADPVLIDDFLGEGKASILALQNGVWSFVRWNGSAFTTTSTGLAADPNRPQYSAKDFTSTDVNGDGLPDLVSVRTDGTIYIRLNTSSGSTVSFASTATLAYTASISSNFPPSGISLFSGAPNNSSSTPNNSSSIRHQDFNGDGRGDITLVTYNAYMISPPDLTLWASSQTLISQGTTFVTGPISGVDNRSVIPVDWNNDKCTDLLATDVNGATTVKISGCSGAVAANIGSCSYGDIAIDWNGDGRTDVLCPNFHAGTYDVYLSLGDGVNVVQSTSLPIFNQYRVFDQNGDGLEDLVRFDPNAGNVVTYGLHNGIGIKPDLMTSITDGYGVNVSPSYVSIVQNNYTKGSGAVYPEKDVQTAMYVASQVVSSDGAGGTFTNTFTYAGLRKDVQGRGSLGFQSKTASDNRTNSRVEKTYFKTAFPYTGMVYQEDVYQNNGTTLISHTVNTPGLTTLDATVNNQRYMAFLASTATDIYEVGGTKNGVLVAQSNTSTTYDNFGNATSSTTIITDRDSTAPASPTLNQSWTTTVANTISPDTTNWCLALPTQTTVTKSATGVTAITRTASFTPDYVKCRVTKQIVEPSSTQYKVTTDFGYDNFGNVNSKIVTGINMTARTTTFDWGATGQFPISVTNPLIQLTAAAFDYNKGVQTSQTDPNGLITSWQYDNFGRKTLETRPDNTTTTWSYNACASVSGGCQSGDPVGATGINKMVVIATSKDTAGTALRDDWTYLDQFDRPIASKSKTLTGSYSREGVQYDSFGRKYREAAPCDAASCTAYWKTSTYDALGRVVQIQRPISASNSTLQTTGIAYQGMTVVTTDPQSKATTKITDLNGWMRRSQDANGYYQNFTYDAFGSLKSVIDSASNTLFSASYAYGVETFQTQTVDMDLGTWNYTNIDALGEVLSYTDAKATAFTMTYDALSRPRTKFVSGDGTTTWTWGTSAAGHNIGQLAGITNTGGTTESYTYDSKGRLSQRHIVSDAAYDFNYNYDPTTGLLDTQTYPTSTSSYRFAVKYVYQYGLLKQVKDNSTGNSFWQANAVNSRGQITQEALGNGIVTNRNYDAVTGWINSIQSGIGGGAGAQNESYLLDKMGNVIQRQNNTLGLTESFCYDNVYRLTKSALSGDATCTTNNNLTIGYNNLGNITNRSDVASNAAWTYHATKKHAVTQAGSASFTYTYDANGNAITRNGFTIGWNKSNYPTSIAGSGETASFFYDGNNQRWKQVYVKGSTTETTIYIGDDLEKITNGSTTDWRHYIKAGDQTIAVYSRQSAGTNTFRYLLDDQQGSIAKITDSAGATYVSESFSAFGNRRNPATWSGAPTAGDVTNINAVSREGYTGQDFIGSLGLNHMNGRVQDAITGRFLSADPYITEPGNTQNYNRYSYVYNNPLSYTDPSGFAAAVVCSDGATVMCITVDLDEIVVGFHLDKSDFLNRQWSADVTQDMLKGFVPIFNYQAPSNADTAPHTGAIPETTVTARRKQTKKLQIQDWQILVPFTMLFNIMDYNEDHIPGLSVVDAALVPGTVGKAAINPKIYRELAKQLSKDGAKSIFTALKSAEATLAAHKAALEKYQAAGGFTSKVETTIRNVESQIETLKQFILDEGL